MLTIFIGCNFIDETHIEMDDDFIEHYQEFISEGILRGQDYSDFSIFIYYSDNIDFDGVTSHDYIPAIKINPKMWYRRPFEIKEHIIFHELGHAILKREHEVDSSHMAYWSRYDELLMFMKDNREFLLDELFR